MHDPIIKIVGIDPDYEDYEELESDIIKRNNLSDNEKLKILHVRSGKTKETQTALVQINREAYKKIMNERKIYAGCRRCTVYDEFNINRCFNCHTYGHSNKNCKNKPTCSKCAGEHKDIECQTPNIQNCINYLQANNKYKIELPTNHKADDAEHSETYQWLLKKRIERTDYPFKPKLKNKKEKIELTIQNGT